MSAMPDVAPTLAVTAAFAQGATVINNIAHLRIKECDRIAVVAEGLRAIGCQVTRRKIAWSSTVRKGARACAEPVSIRMTIIACPCVLPWLVWQCQDAY